MENNSGNGFSEIWDKMNEERRIEQSEREIRYAGRRNAKIKSREAVERTAEKLCTAIETALEKEQSPNDLAALAAAPSGVATAMHAAESYAESIPMYGIGSCSGFCAV